jgi:uncharacterized protein (DUF1330 family)
MSVYLIAEMKWKDTDWLPDYLSLVPDLVKKHGGSYVVQTGEIERLEGTREPTDAIVILEFPDREAALGFMNDPEYESPKAARLRGTISETILVPTK